MDSSSFSPLFYRLLFVFVVGLCCFSCDARRPRAFVHIGPHKTGTTAIQTTLVHLAQDNKVSFTLLLPFLLRSDLLWVKNFKSSLSFFFSLSTSPPHSSHQEFAPSWEKIRRVLLFLPGLLWMRQENILMYSVSILFFKVCSRVCGGGALIFFKGYSLCNTTQHNTIQHYTTLHYTPQHNTTQHNTTQHNTTQYNTTQHKQTYKQTNKEIDQKNTDIILSAEAFDMPSSVRATDKLSEMLKDYDVTIVAFLREPLAHLISYWVELVRKKIE